MFKRILVRMRESIWFIPSVYTAIASLLALGMVLIDTRYNYELKAYTPSYFRTSVDLAQTILGTLSGALLTMTTVTFSTIMVVLTMYSSQFSPRALQNFLNKLSTQRVLGIFMGGFVYTILSLLFMRKASIDHEVISASVGVLLAVICLAYFAFFIHNVGTSVQVSRLIRELANDVIEALKSEKKGMQENAVVWSDEKPFFVQSFPFVTEIKSGTFGYIQYIEYKKLTEWAVGQDAIVDVVKPIGAFCGTHSVLATIYSEQEVSAKDLSSHFSLGEERSILQDVEYGIEKLVEIALRALSPGINDPNTAIRCIHSIGEVLQRASLLPGGIAVTYTKENKPCLMAMYPKADDYFYSAYSQISYYGKEDASVLNALFDSLLYIARTSKDEKSKKLVFQMSNYVWNHFTHEVLEPLDSSRLEEKRELLHVLTA
ncbi:hypothetical protein SporoP37_16000 [Sporosarcina sp. P37]|uniref:DUF2254 domain-containing protein n=1 Tax=unclassified Sporosarcina TaxID=2647733 RepID=UPI000A17B68A|nr:MULTISPECIES: DUF2254 domain-containing protein [unclassified Sporosarcina]ARK26029.1 hypothetical protein SporoP37_16000 [Sporosarcina sp. P37]